MSQALSMWQKLRDKPLGKWLFAQAICWKAPYFRTIAPRFEELKPGYARVSLKKRRAVENHIGTVHAIAACNLAELGAGTMMEASLPPTMRWLPKGMNVQYLKNVRPTWSPNVAPTTSPKGRRATWSCASTCGMRRAMS